MVLKVICRFLYVLLSAIIGLLICGCAVTPANKLLLDRGENSISDAVMVRKGAIVHLTPGNVDPEKPTLLLLHGATDDPTEMLDVFEECGGEYNVFLYSYDFHKPCKKVARDLLKEMARLEAEISTSAREKSAAGRVTVITYSYSAIVFREAVVLSKEPRLFANVSLVQLVPTAGGSRLARWMVIPLVGQLAAWASKPSAAENPYGRFARAIWEGEGNRKFYQLIPPNRIRTLLVEDDYHCLARTRSERVRRRYWNGVGENVVVLFKSTGVTHDYFPGYAIALQCMKKELETLRPETTGNLTADERK